MNTLLNRFSLAVWQRNYLTWKRLIWSSLASNVVNPLLFLFAFGFGLGSLIETIAGVTYLAYVVPGIMAYSAMFAASFESTISAYARFSMQRTWDATLSTPVRLVELLTGELIWSATKGMISAMAVIIVGLLWGGIPSWPGALAALPVILLASICFAACGLLATSYATSWEMFSYFFTFWVTPMFMFSGTFFEVSRFPEFIEWLAWLLPMTHVIAVIRPLMTGAEVDAVLIALHVLYVAMLAGVAFFLAHRRLTERLFD